MTVLVVLFMFVAFVLIDVVVRLIARRLGQHRVRREREAALAVSVRLDVADEAKSLHRAEVPNPRARILAVDDEPVVLDSLRRILVLDGYSVDTVENGPEALHLVQRHDYDFVFTDLKMPEMDGVEVVKAVHHLRPDVDLAVITGFATIQSAVETMQHGAVGYVEKPFTPDELTDFVRTLVYKREARLEAQRRPTVRVVAPPIADAAAAREFCVPGGAFLSGGHAWVRLEPDGKVRVGPDDFIRKALGGVQGIELPEEGAEVRRGESLFSLRRGEHMAHFTAPVSGRIMRINTLLQREPEAVSDSPYDRGWICVVQPSDLQADLAEMKIGKAAIDWYQQEIEELCAAGGPAEDGAPAVDWETLERRFLRPAAVAS